MAETGELEFVEDLAPAAWLADGIRGFAENVGSIVPHGFDAYARIFHPASLDGAPVSWGEVARANRKVMHAEAQFESLTGVRAESEVQPGLWDHPPADGRLPGTSGQDAHDIAAPLVEVLAAHTTTTARVWFCVWEGWGGLRAPDFDARLRLPNRAYWLLRGQIDAVRGGFAAIGVDGPSIWWPDDRAWCVATEIDFRWTYVAGSTRLVHELVADPRFEALPSAITDGVQIDTDHINS